MSNRRQALRMWRQRFRDHRKGGLGMEESAELATEDVRAEFGEDPDWESILEAIIKILTLILSFI